MAQRALSEIPDWNKIEPAVMELWAKGILEAETKELYATHAMMLLCDSLWFFFSIIWRALVVGFLFWVV